MKNSKKFRWIQIEVSSLCRASCIYCPHKAYKNLWKGGLISKDIFEKIVPVFRDTELVFLQGWGEPLLHPLFFEFVKKAKREGSLVGTTTNGMLINENVAKKIVDSGIDIISFSLVGSSSRNDEIRKGTSIDRVLKSIEQVRKEREKERLSIPRIHVAYLLLRSMISELKTLPDIVTRAGAEKIVVSTLSLITEPDLASEKIDTQELLNEGFFSGINGRIEIEIETGLDRSKKLHPTVSRCPERPMDSFFVNSNGRVAPCVFLGLPLKSAPLEVISFSFGSLFLSRLEEILNRPSYRAFREDFSKNKLPFFCIRCPRLDRTYLRIVSKEPCSDG